MTTNRGTEYTGKKTGVAQNSKKSDMYYSKCQETISLVHKEYVVSI